MSSLGAHCQALARLGEDAAAAYLIGLGCEIVARNVRSRRGEIDIVARDGDTIVFVEVKARSSDRFGTPAEAVHHRKQERLRWLAAAWLAQSEVPEPTCRFDVISVRVRLAQPEREPHIEHIRHAF